MIDFAADSAVFLADSEHTATVPGFDPVAVIYDEPFKLEQIYEGQVETSAPACCMLDSDAARMGVQHGTVFTVSKRDQRIGAFSVIGMDSDGAGLTRLTLTKE